MMRGPLALLAFAALAACSSSAGTTPATAQTPQPAAHADWPRFGVDVGRSNAFGPATGIGAANVASLQRQQVHLDGTVDASPIYLHGVQVNGATHDVFFVTTTYGKTLAIDADDGSVLWRYSPAGYDAWAGSYRITTATPAADPDRSAIYAASPDGRIQKLAVSDGHVLWSTAITLLPEREKIASSINVFDGRVIATTGGYIGDAPPYQGHVAILDASSGQLLHVWNALCSDRAGLIDPSSCPESDAAIWGRAGAVIDSADGHILVATGNAPWDGQTAWGDATLELDANATGIVGNYTPSNTATLNRTDQDIGSTSPALLDDSFIVQGGKDGKIRLLDRRRMQGTTPHQDDEVQIVSTPSGTDLFTAPAVLHTDSVTWLFAADNGGTAAWTFRAGTLHQAWKNSTGGTSPVLAGGLLFVYDPHGGLNVYLPASGQRITTLDCGSGHWNSPIIVDGRIALPEGNANHHATSGVLDIWRLTS
ncbi:MAG TPA: PQQ-binding-like beta-propeller repeat protein [Longimicrobiales bacterium]|nr:PQQ-binding-like beta-propeller repeat protein [Longimicrobiales bacterium]